MTRLRLLLRRVRRAVLRRRRLLAGLAAAAAVLAGYQATTAPAPATTPLLTAARDLPAGTVLEHGDLTRARFLPASVPTGVVPRAADAVGRTVAAPVRAGEPIVDLRLVSPALLDGHPGAVAAPVRIGDPGAVALLRVGDVVDVLAADPRRVGPATAVAESTTVIALPAAPDGGSTGLPGGASGRLVVLAVDPEAAKELAGAAVSGYLSVVLTH